MESQLIIASAFIIAILLGRLLIPKILIISFRKRLFDVPNERKIHKRPISRLGGFAFFPVILFTFTIFIALEAVFFKSSDSLTKDTISEFLFLIAGLTLMHIVGLADDLVGVRYRKKFLIQFISASFFPLSGLYVNDFYGLFGIHEVIPAVGIPLTILLVVFITNAINLIDGIDGLASGLSMVALCIFGSIFMYYEYWIYTLLAFITIGVLIPFFSYNVFGNADKGHKIFMGDTGSLTLGFILSFFVIRFCMYIPNVEMQTSTSPVLIAFSLLMVPCLDVIRVVLRRARKREALFMPDKTHIHHKFLKMGYTPHQALIIILLMSICFCVFTIIGIKYINNTIIFCIDIIVWTVLNLWFDMIIDSHKSIES